VTTRDPSAEQLSLGFTLPQRAPLAGGVEPGAGSPRPSGSALSASEIARILDRPAPTREQVAVIEAPVAPLLVVAGAGSGKTETMAGRLVWLVANGHVQAEQVLGLTFTRKAAGELADRVRSRLRALSRRGLVAESSAVTVSTYHAYAATVLADQGLRIGVEPGVRLLGEAGAWQLVDDIVERWDGEMTDVQAARRTVVDAVLALAGECAEHLVDADDLDAALAGVLDLVLALPAEVGQSAPGVPKGALKEVVQRLSARRRLVPIVHEYARRKREFEAIDFGDQVALAARIADQVPEVGAGERERYRVVLLDEYQDTSHAQLMLLRALFGGGHPVTAVGDPHQAIFGWRGASAGNLQRFGGHFPTAEGAPASVLHLPTSWRNDRAVLTAANRCAEPLRAPTPWADPSLHVEVPALEARPDAVAGSVEVAWLATLEDEAQAIAELAVQRWRPARAGVPATSVAVLCRTRALFPLIEGALRDRGLPVEVVGLGGLLHVPEVADLRAALEVLHDPARGDSLIRLLAGPACRIGPRDLDALGAWAASRRAASAAPAGAEPLPAVAVDAVDERSIVEALDHLPPPGWRGADGEALSPEGHRRLARLAGVLRGLRASGALPLPDLVLEVERALLLDVEVAARPGVGTAAARAHLDAFADVAAGFAGHGERPSLGAFLGWLAAAEARENALESGVVDSRDDAVQLLTVHAAKGLEWDVVAIAGLAEGCFPNRRNGGVAATSSGWLTDYGALPFPLRGDAACLPEWRVEGAASQQALSRDLDAFKADCGAHEVAEERRLAYVAITRARQHVLLTGAQWGDGSRPRVPSRFLTELAELAGDPSSGVELGPWVGPAADGEANPREALTRSSTWPLDVLGQRRPVVEEGAALVLAALAGPDAGGTAPAGASAEAEGTAEAADGPADWSREVDLLLAERDAGRSARLEVELPAHLSASQAVALAADPRALAARMRRPLPQPPSPQARRGSAFHAWLERRFGAAALVDVDDLPGAADPAVIEDVEAAELAELQARFLASEWAARRPEAVEVAVETPVGDLVLRGRIDAVFRREDGGWDVVDWKTGSPPAPRDASSRAVQLAVYRLAWARLHGVALDRVSAAFFYAAIGATVRPVDLLDEPGLLALIDAATA
jgi:DNA helicase-2/ATP-dependent DNA helicase PcrA